MPCVTHMSGHYDRSVKQTRLLTSSGAEECEIFLDQRKISFTSTTTTAPFGFIYIYPF